MARPGITYVDVSKAAHAIQNQGDNPTVDRVLAYLGTGSKSTIAPLLKQWKGKNGQGPTTTTGLPDELVEALKNLYDQVSNQAEEKIRLTKEESQKVVEQLQQQLADTEDAARSLSKTNAALEKRLEETIHHTETLTAQLDEAAKKIVKKEAEINSTKQQLTDRKETINDQKAEVRRIRDHLEHYQAEIAEERQRERQQLQSQIAHLEFSLSQTIQTNDNALKKVSVLENSLNQSREQLRACETQNQAVAVTLQMLEKDKQYVENEAKATSDKLIVIEQQFMSTNNSLQDMKKENAIMRIERDTLKYEQQQLEDKVTDLTDKCEVLRQDKAVLEGQFKQLQSSL